MNALLSRESSASRFAAYVEELRELFISYGMKTGETEDILPLVSRLTAPGPTYDDITSILRSVIYREHEAIPRPELLRLIVVAVAGSSVYEPTDEIQQAIRQLESYVGEVIASLRRGAFADDPDESQGPLEMQESPEPESLPKHLPAAEVFADSPIPPQTESDDSEVKVPDDLEPESAVPLLQPPNLRSSHFTEPMPMAAPAAFQPSPHLHIQPVSSILPVRANKPHTSLRSAWIIGMTAMLVIALASIFLRHRSPVRPIPATISSPVAASTPALQSEPAFNAVPNTAEHASPAEAELAQSKPSTADRVSPPTPGVATLPLIPSAPPSRPPQSQPQPSASSISRSPDVRTPGRPRPTPQRQATASASASTTQAKQASGKSASFLVSSGVMDGNLITIPKTPNYPKMANMAGIEGKVILQAVISRNGNVVATHVLDGHRLLRGAAAHAVRGWRYRPYLVRGKPTDVATIVIVDFHLPH